MNSRRIIMGKLDESYQLLKKIENEKELKAEHGYCILAYEDAEFKEYFEVGKAIKKKRTSIFSKKEKRTYYMISTLKHEDFGEDNFRHNDSIHSFELSVFFEFKIPSLDEDENLVYAQRFIVGYNQNPIKKMKEKMLEVTSLHLQNESWANIVNYRKLSDTLNRLPNEKVNQDKITVNEKLELYANTLGLQLLNWYCKVEVPTEYKEVERQYEEIERDASIIKKKGLIDDTKHELNLKNVDREEEVAEKRRQNKLNDDINRAKSALIEKIESQFREGDNSMIEIAEQLSKLFSLEGENQLFELEQASSFQKAIDDAKYNRRLEQAKQKGTLRIEERIYETKEAFHKAGQMYIEMAAKNLAEDATSMESITNHINQLKQLQLNTGMVTQDSSFQGSTIMLDGNETALSVFNVILMRLKKLQLSPHENKSVLSSLLYFILNELDDEADDELKRSLNDRAAYLSIESSDKITHEDFLIFSDLAKDELKKIKDKIKENNLL